MWDSCFNTVPQDGVTVTDHLALGRLVAEWALDPRTRPASPAELRRQLDGVAVVPAEVRRVAYVDEDPEVLTVLLPDPERLLLRADRLDDPAAPLDYALPRFYDDHFSLGTAPVLTPLDMFYARIGDRALSHFP